EERVDPVHGDSVHAGDVRVERNEQELLVEEEHEEDRCKGDTRQHGEVRVRDSEDVSEQRSLEILRESSRSTDDGDADGEARGRHDADRGIGADLPLAGHGVDEERGDKAPQPRSNVEVQLQHVRDDGAAEDRVAEPVADVAHPAQDDEYPEQPAQPPDEAGCDDAANEECVREGLGNRAHGTGMSWGVWASFGVSRSAVSRSATTIRLSWRSTSISAPYVRPSMSGVNISCGWP